MFEVAVACNRVPSLYDVLGPSFTQHLIWDGSMLGADLLENDADATGYNLDARLFNWLR